MAVSHKYKGEIEMNKNKIASNIEKNINKISADAAVLSTEDILVKKKFLNEISENDFKEVRLKDIIKNYDIKEKEGTISIIENEDLEDLGLVVEMEDVPIDKLEKSTKINFKKRKLTGIIQINASKFSDDKTLSDFIMNALWSKLFKTENKNIIGVLNKKTPININQVIGEEGTNDFILKVNSNLKEEHIKNGSIISNYSFYKSIDTYDNRSKGILKMIQSTLYYCDKPMYVVGDSYFGDSDIKPIAFIGSFKKSVGYIEDKEEDVNIAINTKAGFLLDDIMTKISAPADIVELLPDSYIKIEVNKEI